MTGTLPMLETEEGCITESAAIAKYLAKVKNHKMLAGTSSLELA